KARVRKPYDLAIMTHGHGIDKINDWVVNIYDETCKSGDYWLESLLSFAWEDERSDFLENVSKLVADTEVLAVIGYSFPFFNREIDIRVIRAMTKLQKVYFQDRRPADVKERFMSLGLGEVKNFRSMVAAENSGRVKLINDVAKFHLPPELPL